MEQDKFLPPKFSEAMKDLADCMFNQSTGNTDVANSVSRMGFTSFNKSDADH
jgi:hypothetical protein